MLKNICITSSALIVSLLFFFSVPKLSIAQPASNSCVINTVLAYQNAWNGLGQKCTTFKVAKNLYGSITFLDNINQATGSAPVYIYPSGFQFAWIAGSENLENYLFWRYRYGETAGLSVRINSYAGLPDSSVRGQDNIFLAVMDYSIEDTGIINPEIYIPTASFWFNKLRNLYDITVPLEIQKTFALNDPFLAMSTADTSVPIDPIKNFMAMTGTKLKNPDGNKCDIDNYQCPPISHRNINDQSCRAWETVKNVLAEYNPYLITQTNQTNTASCAKAFNTYLNGRNPTAPEYRAMINICQDVNPCNTFLGFGFNPSYTDDQKNIYSVRFTGTEYIVPNINKQNMIKANKATFIKLPSVP